MRKISLFIKHIYRFLIDPIIDLFLFIYLKIRKSPTYTRKSLISLLFAFIITSPLTIILPFKETIFFIIISIIFGFIAKNIKSTNAYRDSKESNPLKSIFFNTIEIIIWSSTAFGALNFITFINRNGSEKFELDYAIEELNAKDKFIQAQKVKDDFININDKSCDSYQIRIKNEKIFHEQPFETKTYTRNQAIEYKQDKTDWGKLCDKFELAQYGFPVSSLAGNVEDMKFISAFQNFFATLLKSDGEIHVLVRGYADKTNNSWRKPLLKDYFYEETKYYKANDSFKSSYTINSNNIETHKTPIDNIGKGFYNNNDLPYLRAKFVLDKYFDGFLKSCIKSKSSSGILEGEISQEKNPQNRNVEVYITVCTTQPKPGCAATR